MPKRKPAQSTLGADDFQLKTDAAVYAAIPDGGTWAGEIVRQAKMHRSTVDRCLKRLIAAKLVRRGKAANGAAKTLTRVA